MTVYNDFDGPTAQATIFVHEDPKSAKVTYRGASGRKFSVMIHQKPNPIGFHARLPGDRKAKP